MKFLAQMQIWLYLFHFEIRRTTIALIKFHFLLADKKYMAD